MYLWIAFSFRFWGKQHNATLRWECQKKMFRFRLTIRRRWRRRMMIVCVQQLETTVVWLVSETKFYYQTRDARCCYYSVNYNLYYPLTSHVFGDADAACHLTSPTIPAYTHTVDTLHRFSHFNHLIDDTEYTHVPMIFRQSGAGEISVQHSMPSTANNERWKHDLNICLTLSTESVSRNP